VFSGGENRLFGADLCKVGAKPYEMKAEARLLGLENRLFATENRFLLAVSYAMRANLYNFVPNDRSAAVNNPSSPSSRPRSAACLYKKRGTLHGSAVDGRSVGAVDFYLPSA
jgi:hypothetical protein